MSREGGDWMCSACQHINFKKRDWCQQCRCSKYGASNGINGPVVLAGDWYCNTINCGAHNYASRTSCYICGSIKDDYCSYPGGMIGEALPELDVVSTTMLAGWNVSSAKHQGILVVQFKEIDLRRIITCPELSSLQPSTNSFLFSMYSPEEGFQTLFMSQFVLASRK
ncbi:hypothetical protein Acr_13g0011820 [Actinidia rufa]|uniref:RanBP2-type domain-containing protein n=1 Tax=Actinidia rufa TaxID=165716 RepID=A0A7J0FM27_9ERIC|nr:hypothetical protein Acr_13g0011820 [Actinidia rufa]